MDGLIALILRFDREIADTTREIEQRANEDDRVDVLCQIRGVGRYTALLIIAEIGDVTRFPTARHLCSWAGLAPTVGHSDGKARLGHISRQGSPALRWALVEAAQKITTGSGPLREKFEPIAKRRGRKIAKSRSPARSSPCPTTAYATERSVAWRAAAAARARREAGGMNPAARSRSTACARDRGVMRTLGRARRFHGLDPRDGRPLD